MCTDYIFTEICFLPLAGGEDKIKKSPSVDGLILLPSGQSKGEFKRLGCLSLFMGKPLNNDAKYSMFNKSSTSWRDGVFTCRIIECDTKPGVNWTIH